VGFGVATGFVTGAACGPVFARAGSGGGGLGTILDDDAGFGAVRAFDTGSFVRVDGLPSGLATTFFAPINRVTDAFAFPGSAWYGVVGASSGKRASESLIGPPRSWRYLPTVKDTSILAARRWVAVAVNGAKVR
jgi:hypothetical protein